jgi:hypothetical protein
MSLGMKRWPVMVRLVGGLEIVVDVKRQEVRIEAGMAEQAQQGDYELVAS